MSKRKRFVLVASLLTLGLLGIQTVGIDRRYEAIIFFSGISIILSAWALLSDLKGIEWLTVLSLPALYPASVALFYFLLPESIISKIILLGLFGLGMYALLLTENIYSVAAIRTIQLLRAAHAVGFLITILTAIFLIGTLLSLRQDFWVNAGGVGLIVFILLIQGLWSAILSPRLPRSIITVSAALAAMAGILAAAAGFLPIIPLVSAFLVSGYLYVILGIMQHELQGRLFAKTVQEYLTVAAMVLAAAAYVTFRR